MLIQSAPSALTGLISADRSARSSLKAQVAVSRPAAAHANRPESWSTNHRQVHVVTLVGDLIDTDRGNPANRSVEESKSAHTRDKIAPTVRHAIRISSVIALLVTP